MVPDSTIASPKMPTFRDAASVTAREFGATETVPLCPLVGSSYENVPGVGNEHDELWLGSSTSAHGVPVKTTLWRTVSLFVQLTESPLWTLTLCGLNPALVMSTPAEPARALEPAASTTSATAASKNFLISCLLESLSQSPTTVMRESSYSEQNANEAVREAAVPRPKAVRSNSVKSSEARRDRQ
jgi:hypothetical protein